MERNGMGGSPKKHKLLGGDEISTDYLGEIPFEEVSVNKKNYFALMNRLRSMLSGTKLVSGIGGTRPDKPLLPKKYGQDAPFKYFDIAFNDEHGQTKTRCRFQAFDLYFIGFQAKTANGQDAWYYLNGWLGDNGESVRISGISDSMIMLPSFLTVNYNDLEIGRTKRANIRCGGDPLKRAVNEFSKYRGEMDAENLRVPILLMTQMFSEALRFPRIFRAIYNFYEYEGSLGDVLVSMERLYDTHSWTFTKNTLVERRTNVEMDIESYKAVKVVSYYGCLSYEVHQKLDNGTVEYKVKNTEENKRELHL